MDDEGFVKIIFRSLNWGQVERKEEEEKSRAGEA